MDKESIIRETVIYVTNVQRKKELAFAEALARAQSRRDVLGNALKLAVFGVLLPQIACKKSQDLAASNLSLLTEGGGTCPVSPDTARIAQVQGLINPHIRTGTDSSRTALFGELAKLPDDYLNFIAKTQLEVNILGPIDGGIVGWCQATSMGGRGGEPTNMQLHSNFIRGGGTGLHEFGRALHSYLFDKYRAQQRGTEDPLNLLQTTYNAIVQQRQGNEVERMGDYAQTQPVEFWAELFSSFYCAPQTNQGLQTAFPKSYMFASQFMTKQDGSAPTTLATPPPGSQTFGNNNNYGNNNYDQNYNGTQPGQYGQTPVQNYPVQPNPYTQNPSGAYPTGQPGSLEQMLGQLIGMAVQAFQGGQLGLAEDRPSKIAIFGPSFSNFTANDDIIVDLIHDDTKEKLDLSKLNVEIVTEGGHKSRMETQLSKNFSKNLYSCHVKMPDAATIFGRRTNIQDYLVNGKPINRTAKVIVSEHNGRVLAEKSGYIVEPMHFDFVADRDLRFNEKYKKT